MPQHIIFGAGLVGGYLGATLRYKGESVALVVRPQLRSRYEKGLLLTDFSGNQGEAQGFTLIDSDAKTAPLKADFLWLTVKCTGVDVALQQLPDYVGPDTVIICCQNGLGSDAPVKQAFPDNTVLKLMFQFNVASPAENHLHRSTDGEVAIEDHEAVRPLLQRVRSPLLPINAYEDMNPILWAKLQLNLSNAIGALGDITTKAMLEDRDYRKVLVLLMKELLAVTRAQGLDLPKLTGLDAEQLPGFMSLPNWLFKLLGRRMLAIDPNARLSMWWDMKNGKPTEVDHLNGAVVSAGKRLGIDCPCNQTMVELVHAVERGELQQGMSGEYLLRQLQGS